jgi:uncharacterized membrane protein
MGMRTWLQSTFLSGLVVLAPIGLTVYILVAMVTSFDELLWTVSGGRVALFPGAGLIAALVAVLLVGFIARNVLGKMLVRFLNGIVERIPVVASLYKLFRQISETFLGGGSKGFQRVVFVEWPKSDSWTLAFVTSELKGPVSAPLEAAVQGPMLNLFIPTTPNPTSGFYIIVSESRVRPTSLSVEEAFKVIISGGALSPNSGSSATAG